VIDQEMLAAWLGSSVTPVREALRRLEAEQLVSLRAHSDARVAPVSIEEFQEFHTVRMGLEPIAAEQAAVSASDEEIAAIRRLQQEGPPSGASIEVELDRSRSLHRAIYAASGNRTVTQILDTTWDRISRYRVIFARVGSIPTCDSPEHEQIVDALEQRDRELVNRLIRSDLDVTFQRILPIAGEALQPYR
jgi:DNA-binding GntR family transcriptional regulator